MCRQLEITVVSHPPLLYLFLLVFTISVFTIKTGKCNILRKEYNAFLKIYF